MLPIESKVTLVVFSSYKKCLIAFGETSSQSETALCSAVVAQSGTDAMVPLVPWPVPGHQRLDIPSESAGCLAARKKKKRDTLELGRQLTRVGGTRNIAQYLRSGAARGEWS